MSASAPRRVAYRVLRRAFEDGAWVDRTLRAEADRHRLEGRERAQARRLAYGAVQRRGTADHLVERLARRPVASIDAPVLAALRLGLYELFWTSATPDHAAVTEAVELVKRDAPAASGLVNAVLRRAAREREKLLAGLEDSTPAGAAIAHSYPVWLAELWWDELGADDALALMRAFNEPRETALRVNTLRAEPERVAAELAALGEAVERPAGGGPLAPAEALVARGALREGVRDRIESGELVAQSRASQAVVELLDPQPGERILDLCAGPGVKTAAIAARAREPAELVAVELDPDRAAMTEELCRRLGVRGLRLLVADAASADLGEGYDRVLVDPPCSDLGTLAARPDARWRKSAVQVEELAAIQARILARAVAALRRGGTLVYSTCTISARENERLVAGLLDREPALVADALGESHPGLASSLDRRFVQTRPDRDRSDGFFIARLRRAGA